jgi:DNA topoisomerase-3
MCNYILCQGLLDGDMRSPRDGGHDDKAHPPIHPTKADPGLSGDEQRVYELVARHFLACVADDAMGQQTDIECLLGDECFTASGLMVTQRNYLNVYRYESWTGRTIPVFQLHNSFAPSQLQMTTHSTAPPRLLTESDLISLMDKHGIGTDATIAQHITKIQERDYVFVDPRTHVFAPKDLGVALVDAYDAMGLAAMSLPTLRAHMEADLLRVGDGRKQKEEVLAACLRDMKEVFEVAMREAKMLDVHVGKFFSALGEDGEGTLLTRALSLCGLCDGPMDLLESASMADPERSQQPAAGVGRHGSGADSSRARARRFVRCAVCAQSHALPGKGALSATEPAVRCGYCSFQALVVTNLDDGKAHTLCPRCFNSPPVEVENAANATAGGFRCFQCAHPACPLAKKVSARVVGKCSGCHCAWALAKGKTPGQYILSCPNNPLSRTPHCKPVFFRAQSAVPSEAACVVCSTKLQATVFKVLLRFLPGQMPPHIDLEQEACLSCDSTLAETLNYRLPPPGAIVESPAPASNNALRVAGGHGQAASRPKNSNNPSRPPHARPHSNPKSVSNSALSRANAPVPRAHDPTKVPHVLGQPHQCRVPERLYSDDDGDDNGNFDNGWPDGEARVQKLANHRKPSELLQDFAEANSGLER